MTAAPVDDGLDLLRPDRVRDPFPFFAGLREHRPVAWSATHRAWLVSRHDDLTDCLFDERLSSDRIRPVFETKLSPAQQEQRRPTYALLEDWMVFTDPPRHTRLRGLVRKAFTPRAVARLEPRIVEVVDGLLDGLAGETGEVDLIARFCYPIPAVVIAEMMGVPRADVERFKAWSDCVLTLVFGTAPDRDRQAAAQDGLIELRDYLAELVERFRRAPAENLISDLAAAVEDDDRLSTDEIVATCVLLLFGGHETTTNLIGNGTRALTGHPEALRWMLDHPDAMPGVVEELLRYDGPSKLEVRRCVADLRLRGETITEGSQVFLLQGAANRDPDAFADPDRLDPTRTAGRHLGFGLGVHYCLGAPIARLEGRIALERLLRRFPELRPGRTPESWHATLVSRGMTEFPVRLHGGCL